MPEKSPLKKFLMPECIPSIHDTAFIAPGAVVLGAVTVGERASVWYGCVMRGDINRIVLGPSSNLQDGCIVHVSDDYPAIIGERVSVGHRAIVHACEVGDEVLVGMGAIIMDGAVIGPRSIIGAGAMVTKGTQVPEGSLVLGSPARVVRSLTLAEQQDNARLAAKYVEVSRRYREMFPSQGKVES
jgi:carbonic anhydrase/acetyltransferase-like protein (isoleucine patch superfamily)